MLTEPPPPLPPHRARTPKISAWLPVIISAAILAIAGALAYLYQNDPAASSSGALLFPSCRFYQITGLKCAGCGLTRAFHHLLHGRFGTAFYFNPLFFCLLPLFTFWGLREARRVWLEAPISPVQWQRRVLTSWIFIGLIFVYTAVRNFSWWPWF
jgi:hypothetical protein